MLDKPTIKNETTSKENFVPNNFSKFSFENLWQVWRRFGFLLIFNLVITCIALIFVDNTYSQKAVENLIKIMTSLSFAWTFGVGLKLFSEKAKLAIFKLEMFNFGVFALVFALYFLFLSFNELQNFQTSVTIFISSLVVLVWLFSAPFLFTKEDRALWQFWWKNFIGIFFTGLFCGILTLGLFSAIGAINFLFKANLDYKVYSYIFIIITTLFAPIFYLSDLPKDLSNLSHDFDYPKILKVLTQFILLPLVIFYLVILYFYGIRVLTTQDWPEGQVVYLILSLILPSILTAILLFPLARDKSWIKKVIKGIFIGIIPLLYLYFRSLLFRINDYGITENRYFVGLFGIWILIISLYFGFFKKPDLRVLPITFMLLATLSVTSFSSSFYVAKVSQKQRLEKVLIQTKILQNGKLQKVDQNSVSKKEAKMIYDGFDYFDDRYGYRFVRNWFDDQTWQKLNLKNDKSYQYKTENILTELGFERNFYSEYSTTTNQFEHFNLDNSNNKILKVENYKYSLDFKTIGVYECFRDSKDGSCTNPQIKEFYSIDNSNFNITLDSQTLDLEIFNIRNQSIFKTNLKNSLEKKLPINSNNQNSNQGLNRNSNQELEQNLNTNSKSDEILLEEENSNIKIKIYLQEISGRKDEENNIRAISGLDLQVLLDFKNQNLIK